MSISSFYFYIYYSLQPEIRFLRGSWLNFILYRYRVIVSGLGPSGIPTSYNGCGRFKRDIYWSSLVLNYREHNENFLSGYYVTADAQSHTYYILKTNIVQSRVKIHLNFFPFPRVKRSAYSFSRCFHRSPEKTLPLHLSGMARMEQHKKIGLEWGL